jgi:hypothetical protein
LGEIGAFAFLPTNDNSGMAWRLGRDAFFSEFDRKILATLDSSNEFSMRSFIDSPCEN